MPSGYTSVLIEKNLDFEQFTLLCARAFGSCISMRDDPLDKPIPEKIEPISTYHKDEIARYERKLKTLNSLKTKEAKEKWAERILKSELTAAKKYMKEEEKNKDAIDKYKSMLARVKKWEPPSDEHHGLKKFMIEQLTDSIKFDGHSAYWTDHIVSLEEWMKKPIQYYKEELEKTIDRIKYHTEHWAKDVESAEKATRWLQNLRKSLKKEIT